MQRLTRFRSTLWPACLTVAVLLVYVRTLPVGPGLADTAKFQFLGRILGTAHAPGYPGYILLCGLFDRLWPWGDAAYRANLVTALLAVAAVCLLFHLMRSIGCTNLAAASIAVAFAWIAPVWQQAIEAEVYSLHLVFVAAILLAVDRFQATGRSRYSLVIAALLGLALGNHLMIVCLLPGIALTLWIGRQGLQRRHLAGMLLLLITAGLGQYAFVVWRTFSPEVAFLETQAHTLGELLRAISGGQHKWNFLHLGPTELLTTKLPTIVATLVRECWPLLPLAVIGAATFGPGRRLLAVHGLIVCQLVFVLLYSVPDVHVYLLPVYLGLAVLAGCGLDRVIRSVPPRARLSALLLPIGIVAASSASIDSHVNEDWARALIAQTPEDAVLLSLDYGRSMALLYTTLIEPEARDRTVLHMPPVMLRLPHGWDPVAGYLRGQPWRIEPHGHLLESGRPVIVVAPSPQQLERLTGLGLAASPAGDRLHRLHAWHAVGREPLAQAFVVRRITAVSTPQRAVEHMAGFDPRLEAVSLGGTSVELPVPTGAEAVAIVESTSDLLRVRVDLEAPGWLVLPGPFNRGWSFQISGRAVAPLRLNLVHWAIELPAGRHEVSASRTSKSFRPLRWLGLVRDPGSPATPTIDPVGQI